MVLEINHQRTLLQCHRLHCLRWLRRHRLLGDLSCKICRGQFLIAFGNTRQSFLVFKLLLWIPRAFADNLHTNGVVPAHSRLLDRLPRTAHELQMALTLLLLQEQLLAFQCLFSETMPLLLDLRARVCSTRNRACGECFSVSKRCVAGEAAVLAQALFSSLVSQRSQRARHLFNCSLTRPLYNLV